MKKEEKLFGCGCKKPAETPPPPPKPK